MRIIRCNNCGMISVIDDNEELICPICNSSDVVIDNEENFDFDTDINSLSQEEIEQQLEEEAKSFIEDEIAAIEMMNAQAFIQEADPITASELGLNISNVDVDYSPCDEEGEYWNEIYHENAQYVDGVYRANDDGWFYED